MTSAAPRLNLADAELDRFREQTPHVLDVIHTVRQRSLTYLSDRALVDLASAVISVEQEGLAGAILETGTALGGSAIVLAAAKTPARPLRLYDVFGLIPPPTDADGPDVHERYQRIAAGESKGLGGQQYYGYRTDLIDQVRGALADCGYPPAEHNVELIQGRFQETLDCDDPVALAHLDGDWYESTKVCLDRIGPRVIAGGRLVIDDYYAWSGCRTAVDEFLAGAEGGAFEAQKRSRLHLVRTH